LCTATKLGPIAPATVVAIRWKRFRHDFARIKDRIFKVG
jgi:hypothetical protein